MVMTHYLLIDGPNNNYGLLILLYLFVAFGVPILLLIAGIAVRPKKKKLSNILLIITATYAIIGLGVCGALLF